MVELISTIVIVGILAAVAVPRIGTLTDYSGPVHAAEIRADLMHARKTAVAARRFVCVAISTNTVTFTMDPNDPDNLTTPHCSSSVAVSLPGGDQTGILNPPSNVPVTSSTPGFYFKPTGDASADVTISAGGQSVTVSAVAGVVS